MFKGKEALEKIDALNEKFGFDVGYYSTFNKGQRVKFYPDLGDSKKNPITREEYNEIIKSWNEFIEKINALTIFLGIEYVEKENFYRKIK